MTTHVSLPDAGIREQLSAFLDGELPEAEARFLQKRLQHDHQLRALWERLQLASACMKGQALRPMQAGLCERIHAAVEPSLGIGRSHSHWALAIAASVAVAAVLFAPKLSQGPAILFAQAGLPANSVATPGSADLVAVSSDEILASTPVAIPAAPKAAASDARNDAGNSAVVLTQTSTPSPVLESPLPLSAQSPADFPLAEGSTRKTWPRSLVSTNSDSQALEAYLVRHNQLMAGDGLGGFFPYLDVVAGERDSASTEARDQDQETR